MNDTSTTELRNIAEPGKPVMDPSIWTGKELESRSDWIVPLDQTILDDLKTMASSVRERIGDDPSKLLDLTKDDFDIGSFAGPLGTVRQQLKDGLGLAVIRGLPVDDWDRLDLMIAYWAMGRHLGKALSNNGEGDMIGHVLDAGKDQENPNHRGYQTQATMDYHLDQCDVVCLICLQTSKSGGLSKLASSVLVHNKMLERRPDLVEELTVPFYWTRHGEIGPGQKPWYNAPIFNYVDGYLSTSSGPKHIEKGHKLPDTPDLTERQIEAIELVAEICEEFHAEIAFEKGDIQLLNGAVTMHTRTEFEDWPEPERRRHLWRLWLGMPDIRPRSPFFENWRDGIQVAGMTERLRVDYVEGGG
jgi:hypothetical protein